MQLRTERIECRVSPTELEAIDLARGVVQQYADIRHLPSRADLITALAVQVLSQAIQQRTRVNPDLHGRCVKAMRELARDFDSGGYALAAAIQRRSQSR